MEQLLDTLGALTLALLGAGSLLLAMSRRIRENEAKVRRLNRTLRSIRECDKALVLAKDEPGLLKDVCRILIEEGGYRLVWVGYAEQDEDRTVRPVAQAGFEVGYLEGLRVTWADDEYGRGPTGIAIRTGRPSVARDILTDPNFAPWRQPALRRGFASGIALPLLSGAAAFGVLAVYSGQTEAFDAEETALLAELAGSLGYGILALRDREAKEKAQGERRHLEAELLHLQRIQGIGRLAGGIAHAMNNVLAAIMAVADVIKDGKEDPAAKAELILEATRRGRDLVKGLLDFARKEVQAAEPVDLNRLVRQEAGILASTTLNRIRVDLDLDENLPRLLGSSLAIATSLMNLCVNAMDAMPAGGVLSLRTREDQRGILLEVEDTGHGMAPEVLDRAVEPFYTTKPTGKGTGLGLAVVFGTVQAHGGTLDIRSQPGSRLPIGPILRIISICSRKSSRVSSPEPILAAASSAFCCIEDLLGLLDQAQHVAHAQDAAGHPVGVEDVEVLELLAGRREQDRHAGDLAHRQRRTTAGVAVELGQHHAGEADAGAEGLGGGHGVLADHRVQDEQGLVGVGRRRGSRRPGPSALRRCPAGRRCRRRRRRSAWPWPRRDRRPRRRPDRRAAESWEPAAVPGCGANTLTPARSPTICSWLTAPGRCRSQATSSGVCPWPLQPLGQLAGQGRLTGALQAGEHDDRRRVLGERQLAGLAAEDADELVVDDLDDLLGRVERARRPRRPWRAP